MYPSPTFRPCVGATVRSPSAQYVGDQPCGAKTVARRVFGVAAEAAKPVNAGTIDSRKGNASVTPAPRRKVRRGMAVWVRYIVKSDPFSGPPALSRPPHCPPP